VVHIKGEGSVHDIFELLCEEIDKRKKKISVSQPSSISQRLY
jgi:hypothetical protein